MLSERGGEVQSVLPWHSSAEHRAWQPRDAPCQGCQEGTGARGWLCGGQAAERLWGRSHIACEMGAPGDGEGPVAAAGSEVQR